MASNVLFEIGLEELPARFIDQAEEQLLSKTKTWLDELRLAYTNVKTYSTPRRLAILIDGLADEQVTITEEVRGPSEAIAQDEEGNWSKAAIGFTRGQGKTVDDIYLKDEKGTNYIFVEKNIEGKSATELLPSFKTIIESIEFSQSMRWGSESLRYARPIRWLVALYNETIIPFEIAQVQTGNMTQGHRFLGSQIELTNPTEYEARLRENFVIADRAEREQLILTGIEELEAQEGFVIEVDQALLSEVRNLVEYPTVFFGKYEESFLDMPSEVLITSMQEHQRYFPVKSTSGDLLPYFVSVRNGDAHNIETVARGNEKVLRARLADGKFFYEEDLKQTIDFNLEKLERVVFQVELGTLADKVRRVTEVTKQLATLLACDKETTTQAVRAAEISKFDLPTNMVNEFTELQGVMGEMYAVHFGEDKAVAQAVREHYLPQQAKGLLPETIPGALVSIADKLDTIVGFISVGLTPTGSQDPYSLRRQALGILRILEARAWDVALEDLLAIALDQYEVEDKGAMMKQIQAFFILRAGFLLREKEVEQDVIHAVMPTDVGVFSYTIAKALLLSTKRNDPAFKPVEEALVRVVNLAKDKQVQPVDEALFETPSEQNLYTSYLTAKVAYDQAYEQQDAKKSLAALAELAAPIDAFFENNMVMAKDLTLRNNRLALVSQLAQLISHFADLTVIQWKQHA